MNRTSFSLRDSSALGTLFASSVILIGASSLIGCTQEAAEEEVESSTSQIVGGAQSAPNAWPGTVALFSNGDQVCGGALVADRWVLTASHCVEPSMGVDGGLDHVVIGRQTLSSSAGETIAVDHAYRHPGFSMSTMNNDIALLHLASASSAPKTKLVAASQASTVTTGANVTVVGWGLTKETAWQSSNVLREVTIPIVSNAQCNTWYANEGGVTDNQICAGLPQGGKDSCQGDSGGPLFMKIGSENIQVGLVSWGIGCARAHAPGVYTRISSYLTWLAQRSGGEIAVDVTPNN